MHRVGTQDTPPGQRKHGNTVEAKAHRARIHGQPGAGSAAGHQGGRGAGKAWSCPWCLRLLDASSSSLEIANTPLPTHGTQNWASSATRNECAATRSSSLRLAHPTGRGAEQKQRTHALARSSYRVLCKRRHDAHASASLHPPSSENQHGLTHAHTTTTKTRNAGTLLVEFRLFSSLPMSRDSVLATPRATPKCFTCFHTTRCDYIKTAQHPLTVLEHLPQHVLILGNVHLTRFQIAKGCTQ